MMLFTRDVMSACLIGLVLTSVSCVETPTDGTFSVTEKEAIARIESLGGHVRPWPTSDADTRMVGLHNTAATDEDLALVLSIDGVNWVVLGEKMTDEGLLTLAALPDLERLSLKLASSITAVGLAEFLKALPAGCVELGGYYARHDDDLEALGVYRLRQPGQQSLWEKATHWYLPQHESTPWTDSADGVLSMRILGLPNPRPRDDEPFIIFELRNNSDEALLLDSPFHYASVRTLWIAAESAGGVNKEWMYCAPSVGLPSKRFQCSLLEGGGLWRYALNLEPMLGDSEEDWTVWVVYESTEYVRPAPPEPHEIVDYMTSQQPTPPPVENARHWRLESNTITIERE